MQPIDYVSLWLADFHLLAALLLAVVLACLWRLRQPAQRMAVVRSTLVALASLLALTALPGWSLFHLPAVERTAAAPAVIEQPAVPPEEFSLQPQVPPIVTAPPTATSPALVAENAPTAAPVDRPATSYPWDRLLLIVYAAGSLLVLAWLAVGSLLASRVRRAAVAAPAELEDLLAAVAGSSTNLPALLVSDRIAAPVALGVRRPAILLPASMLTPSLREAHDELAAVLAHEWSHLRNGDLRTLATSRLLLALLWPQPLFWLLRRTLRLDQETLADADAAELAGRVPYAERLLGWARQMNDANSPRSGTPRLAGTVGLWEGPSQLKRRIATLLDERLTILRECSRRWRWTCGALLAAAAIGLSLVTWQPATEANADPPADPAVSRPSRASGSNDDAPAERAPAAAAAAPFEPKGIDNLLGFISRDDAQPNVLHGRCLDERGEPLAGVMVNVYRGAPLTGPQELIRQAKTDEKGEFRFDNVVDVKRTYPEGVIPAQHYHGEPMIIWVTRLPGRVSREAARSQCELVRLGQAMDFVMYPAATLRGTLTDGEGRPVAGALVAKRARMAIADEAFSARSNADGEFAIDDLPPFDLEAERKRQEEDDKRAAATLASEGFVLRASFAPRFVVSHPDCAMQLLPESDVPAEVKATLSPAAKISGQVVLPDGSPAVGALVYAQPSLPITGDWMVNYSVLNFERDFRVTAQTDAQGRYELSSLHAGQYDVWAEMPGLLNPGQGEVATTVGKTAEAPKLQLIDGGVIRLQLVDGETGEPVQPETPLLASIAALPQRRLSRQESAVQQVAVDKNGVASIRVLPGKSLVRLESVSDVEGQAWMPTSAELSAMRIVEVGEGESVDASVKVLRVQPPPSEPTEEPQVAREVKPPAENGSATWHLVQGPAAVNAFRAGPPPEPPVFKKNAFAVQAIDDDGGPIEGVEALLYRASFQDGTHELISTATTDAQGEVEFADLVPEADAAEYERIEHAKEFPPQSAPFFLVGLRKPGLSTATVNHAAFDVALRGARKTVILRPAGELRGTVVDQNGAPVAGATVAAGGFSGMLAIEGVNAVKTDAQGRYVFADRVKFDAGAARDQRPGILKAALRHNPPEDKVALKPLDPGEDLAVTQLTVRHPDFAVATVQGGDVPGTTDVQLAPAAAIAGRVVHFDTGQPAVGVKVTAVGRLPVSDDPGSSPMLFPRLHNAATRTDAEGRYRLSNLPAASYDVWAQPDAYDWSDAEWVCRGVSGVNAEPGAQAAAPDLEIGSGGVIRVQLVDAETGKPLEIDGDRPFAVPYQQLVDGPLQSSLVQRPPVSSDGRVDLRVLPGKSRIGVMVTRNGDEQYGGGDYRTRDGIEFDGPVFDVGHGQRIEAEFSVYPVAVLEKRRAERAKGFELLQAGKLEEAVAAFDAALAAYPDEQSPRFGRANALDRLGRIAEAIADYETLLANSPNDPVLLNNLASNLATASDDALRNGARAVELAERAVAGIRKASERQASLSAVLDTLASAHAEVGDFEKAIAVQEEAIELASDKQKAEMQSRLDLYRAGQPYRRATPAEK